MKIISHFKNIVLIATLALLTGCNIHNKNPESENTTRNASLRKLITAKERMKLLKEEMRDDKNITNIEKEYIHARCDFLKESEYLYSTHARIPCHVSTISLKSKESDYIDRANSILIRNFKDPESARFRNVFVSQTDVPIVCGEVNGKNSYGAYTGFTKKCVG